MPVKATQCLAAWAQEVTASEGSHPLPLGCLQSFLSPERPAPRLRTQTRSQCQFLIKAGAPGGSLGPDLCPHAPCPGGSPRGQRGRGRGRAASGAGVIGPHAPPGASQGHRGAGLVRIGGQTSWEPEGTCWLAEVIRKELRMGRCLLPERAQARVAREEETFRQKPVLLKKKKINTETCREFL
uniref:Uncharacterized protein n=1 Tax=Pipistrellus kuhlii TaxID=59472 RepID=A0A7J7QX61_PIPKU|nr:hypothetical protein mPipKuh1_008226 [Pipistrellus kuhlii]